MGTNGDNFFPCNMKGGLACRDLTQGYTRKYIQVNIHIDIHYHSIHIINVLFRVSGRQATGRSSSSVQVFGRKVLDQPKDRNKFNLEAT